MDLSRFKDLGNSLGGLHGKRPDQIYVIITHEGDTILKDEGLDRPWSSTIKQFAETTAKHISKLTGRRVSAVTLDVAIASLIAHPKNQPPRADRN